MKTFNVPKTSRRVGFQKLAIPKAPKIKQIGTSLGPIRKPKMPTYGSFPKGHVY